MVEHSGAVGDAYVSDDWGGEKRGSERLRFSQPLSGTFTFIHSPPPYSSTSISLIMFAATRSSLRFAASRNGSYAGIPRSLIARNMNSKVNGKRTSQALLRHHSLTYAMSLQDLLSVLIWVPPTHVSPSWRVRLQGSSKTRRVSEPPLPLSLSQNTANVLSVSPPSDSLSLTRQTPSSLSSVSSVVSTRIRRSRKTQSTGESSRSLTQIFIRFAYL